MDAYKKLKQEFEGMKKVIERYSSQGNIKTYLNGLEKGLEADKIENVLYYLNEICIWYQRNIREMRSAEFVHDLAEHERNKKVLEEIKKDLADYDFYEEAEKHREAEQHSEREQHSEAEQCSEGEKHSEAESRSEGEKLGTKSKSEWIKENREADKRQEGEVSPKIFLSHHPAAKKYGDALEKLMMGLGVKQEQLIYTSHPFHQIPFHETIFEYLKNNINQDVFVIILWSNEYLESPACLNEMGAAWVAQSDYINIYTPDFAFGNPKYHECAVDTRKMGAVLNGDVYCKASMIKFKNKISERFHLTVEEQNWTDLLEQFMEEIK